MKQYNFYRFRQVEVNISTNVDTRKSTSKMKGIVHGNVIKNPIILHTPYIVYQINPSIAVIYMEICTERPASIVIKAVKKDKYEYKVKII